MVVIIDAQAAAHNSVFCDLSVKHDLNDNVKINAFPVPGPESGFWEIRPEANPSCSHPP